MTDPTTLSAAELDAIATRTVFQQRNGMVSRRQVG